MSTDSKHVPPTSKIDVASGPAASGPKPNQLPSSEPLNVHGNAPTKPRSTKKRARRNDRFPAQRKDGAARGRKWKQPNAQKAGLFARPAFIPGEDPREFDRIRDELFAFWKPTGPDLRDALSVLAKHKFHLLRLERYVQTELQLYTFFPRHPGFNEVWGSLMFIGELSSDPENAFAHHSAKYLRRDKVDALKQKFPRGNYQSASEWAKAVTNEILSYALPAERHIVPPEVTRELGYTTEDLEQAQRDWKTDQQVHGFIADARELFEYQAKETERLNGLIMKQTRFCAELKLWEESRDKK